MDRKDVYASKLRFAVYDFTVTSMSMYTKLELQV